MSNATNLPEANQYDFNGNPIRVMVEPDGTPMFCGRDVASALGYANPAKAMLDHCKSAKGFPKRYPLQTAGGQQQFTFITEGDMYRLIVSSQLPEAEEFEQWVFDEVLPSIRKHGAYLTPQKIEEALLNPDTIIQLAQALKDEKQKVQELTPKAGAWDTFCSSGGDMSVADAAKALASRAGVCICRNRLFDYMNKIGWLTHCHGYWEPLQYAVERGLLAVRVNMPRWKDSGESFIPNPTVRVTAKGLDVLAERLSCNPLSIGGAA